MDDLRAELVLRAAECVPAGRVAPYGMLARVTGTHARFVGRVMATYGSGVPWWRVTNARGELPAPIAARARTHWEDEAIPLHGDGVALRRVLADEDALVGAWEAAVADLVEEEEGEQAV
ncbi:MGMT family protein [Brevibacterium litoralis]|uniref:MGMT family protein n=1 Tax=Brevibacterium litoralis TaxID=3138935 RepID=UPI0032EFEF6C